MYIDDNPCFATGASCIGECLKDNCTLKILHIAHDDNLIGDVGISQLIKGLNQNASLTELSLEGRGLLAQGTAWNNCNTGESR